MNDFVTELRWGRLGSWVKRSDWNKLLPKDRTKRNTDTADLLLLFFCRRICGGVRNHLWKNDWHPCFLIECVSACHASTVYHEFVSHDKNQRVPVFFKIELKLSASFFPLSPSYCILVFSTRHFVPTHPPPWQTTIHPTQSKTRRL